MSGASGQLAPWLQQQRSDLLAQRGHAWLLQGPSGMGQFELGMALVRAWLCEQPTAHGACGHCASCHSIDVHAHADLCVLMPEVDMLERGWPLSEKAQGDIDDKKRKPSKEIRVDAMRDAVEFTQRTSARGRGKAVLVYPAEQMNAVTANALLKTLEEPPGDVRFVLATEAAHQLLPTIRSRCLAHTMVWPQAAQMQQWLVQQGMDAAAAQAWLQAAGGRPMDAWRMAQAGRGLEVFARLPKAVAAGDNAIFADIAPPEVVQWLQKLCHDLMCVAQGAQPRYFAAQDLPKPPSAMVLARWAKSLAQEAKTAEQPFNAGLMTEALVAQARTVLRAKA
ncbi:MAG: DNA polymerase III subunit delta' [Comamonas sp.]|nr:DNA polymerase III subunit delta' [Candidatus Comamonas equi]